MIKKLKDKGFTLTELVVVVLLIGILTGYALPRYLTHVEVSKTTEAVDFLHQWQAARAIYFAENETYLDAGELEPIGVDPVFTDDGDFVFKYFSCSADNIDAENNARFATYACDRNGGNYEYRIYASEYNMYCCWNNSSPRSGKICNNISTDETYDGTLLQNNSGMTDMSCLVME